MLDLRFATGQDIHHAALVADGLLDGGLLWRVCDAKGRVKEYKADRDCLFRDMPMAVLVGEHTDSMARALTAALQDRGRAIVVGSPTKPGLFVTSLVSLPEGQGSLLLRTGTVERIVRADKSTPANANQFQAIAGLVVPDRRVAIERKEVDAVLMWRQQQQSPEPKADTKPPADPQLDKAAALLRETLAAQEKKDKEKEVPAPRRIPG